MNQRHGSPYDRGGADRYYGRPYNPHFFAGDTYSTDMFDRHSMTDQEIEEYRQGWNDMTDRKDWGVGDFAPEQSDQPPY